MAVAMPKKCQSANEFLEKMFLFNFLVAMTMPARCVNASSYSSKIIIKELSLLSSLSLSSSYYDNDASTFIGLQVTQHNGPIQVLIEINRYCNIMETCNRNQAKSHS